MNLKALLILIPITILPVSCKQHDTGTLIVISASISGEAGTSFESGDALGLYVVSTLSSLQQSANYADNVKYTYDGSKWVSEKQLHWPEDNAPADLYVYYPYSTSASPTDMSFFVQRDQSREAGYRASNFLYGSCKGMAPSSDPANISMRPLMGYLNIELKAGGGITDNDIRSAGVTVTGLRIAARINLADGSISAEGSRADIQPFSLGGGSFKAIVVPQNVSGSELLKIKIGEDEYTINTSLNIASGKTVKCPVVVNRDGDGLNASIDPWGEGEYISNANE